MSEAAAALRHLLDAAEGQVMLINRHKEIVAEAVAKARAEALEDAAQSVEGVSFEAFLSYGEDGSDVEYQLARAATAIRAMAKEGK